MDLLIIALIGLTVGFVGGFAGIGGAPFIVFLLVWLCGYSQHLAQGTVLAMMLGPMSLPAVWSNRGVVRRHGRTITIIVICYAFSSYFGGSIAYLFPPHQLGRVFGLLLVLIGLTYSITRLEASFHRHIRPWPLTIGPLSLVGLLIGIFGGWFGIGAGVLLVPILTYLFAVAQNEARIISLAILLPPVSVGAVLRYGWVGGDVNGQTALILLATYMICNDAGAALGNHQTPRLLKKILGLLLVLCGLLQLAF